MFPEYHFFSNIIILFQNAVVISTVDSEPRDPVIRISYRDLTYITTLHSHHHPPSLITVNHTITTPGPITSQSSSSRHIKNNTKQTKIHGSLTLPRPVYSYQEQMWTTLCICSWQTQHAFPSPPAPLRHATPRPAPHRPPALLNGIQIQPRSIFYYT